MPRELFANEMVARLLRRPHCRNFCGDIGSTTNDFEALDPETAEGGIRACYAALVDTEHLFDAPRSRGSPGDRARKSEAVIVRVQFRDPQLTHEILRFIERMGFAARALADQEIEVDVPIDVPEHVARLELDLYLSLWRVITERYSVELLC